MSKDYYEILGVNKNSTQDEIKKAYRKKAMELHPDRNPGNKEAETKFKEAAEAYDILHDPDKKAAYDRYGSDAFSGGGGAHGGFSGFQSASFSDFSDIFSSFSDIFADMGSGGGKRTKRSGGAVDGSDLRYDVALTLEEAYRGKTIDIDFATMCKCEDCGGSGSADGSGSIACGSCGGSGATRIQQGFFIMEQTCRKCGGTGKTIKKPCKKCDGTGRVNKNKSLSVKIPAGVDSGSKIKLAGEGEAGQNGGKSGDLFVFTNIKKHEIFTRDKNNLQLIAGIFPTTAMVGGEIEVPTIDGGKAMVNIAAGTQEGEKIKMVGKGMSILGGGERKGDLLIVAKIEIPKNLTNEEKKLAKDLDDLLQKSKSDGGFFKKWFKK
ncbi:MAG: molecular chaperone DnaJ [Rickettsiales bacterium]|jgi:molecular chaperone DnaJ|nr:molecular chaperone DnaJ [Rickettsiales bacterium]